MMDPIPPYVRTGDPIRAADWNALAAATRGARAIPGANTPGRDGLEGFVFDRPDAPRGVRPYQMLPFPFGNLWIFGILPEKGQVTIFNPMARRYGDQQGASQVYTCADTVVPITGDGAGQRIVWSWSAVAGLAIQANAQINDPQDDSPLIRGVVAIFDVTDSVPMLAVGGCIQAGHLLVLPIFTKANV